MQLDPPSIDDILSVLHRADTGTIAEADAFLGAGLWTIEGEASRLHEMAERLPAHVVRDEAGAAMLIMGLTIVRSGVLQTWCITAEGWTRYNGAIVSSYQEIVRKIFAPETGVHRLTVESLAGRPRVREWFESFGFVHEGLLHAAGAQREDIDVYSMVREIA